MIPLDPLPHDHRMSMIRIHRHSARARQLPRRAHYRQRATGVAAK